jgi:hypothetical protein
VAITYSTQSTRKPKKLVKKASKKLDLLDLHLQLSPSSFRLVSPEKPKTLAKTLVRKSRKALV